MARPCGLSAGRGASAISRAGGGARPLGVLWAMRPGWSAVVGVASQPFWLCWQDERGLRRHAPDYFVRRRDGTGVVIDVRADDRISDRDAETFATTARICAGLGWEFRRVGEIEPVLNANIR